MHILILPPHWAVAFDTEWWTRGDLHLFSSVYLWIAGIGLMERKSRLFIIFHWKLSYNTSYSFIHWRWIYLPLIASTLTTSNLHSLHPQIFLFFLNACASFLSPWLIGVDTAFGWPPPDPCIVECITLYRFTRRVEIFLFPLEICVPICTWSSCLST